MPSGICTIGIAVPPEVEINLDKHVVPFRTGAVPSIENVNLDTLLDKLCETEEPTEDFDVSENFRDCPVAEHIRTLREQLVFIAEQRHVPMLCWQTNDLTSFQPRSTDIVIAAAQDQRDARVLNALEQLGDKNPYLALLLLLNENPTRVIEQLCAHFNQECERYIVVPETNVNPFTARQFSTQALNASFFRG